MAEPIEFEGFNAELVKQGEECSSLPIARVDGTCISCWKLTPEELERIKETGVVWLMVWGWAQPPVWIGGDRPFTIDGEN